MSTKPFISTLEPPILKTSRSEQNWDTICRHLLENFSSFSLKRFLKFMHKIPQIFTVAQTITELILSFDDKSQQKIH